MRASDNRSGRLQAPHRAAAGLALAFALASGCASAEPAAEPRPLDAGQLARSAERASALDAPYRIVFGWSLNEPGMRVSGRGVARVEPPYRARIDLFSGNGERVSAAAVVDGELRVPAGDPSILPPPALLWGTLGVFRPDRGMPLAGGSWRTDGSAELRYLPSDGAELLIRLGESRIREMVHRRGGRVVHELSLRRAPDERFPREAIYRDVAGTRELRMTLETVEHVETYPSDIWDPR